jgi:hypothetical protein
MRLLSTILPALAALCFAGCSTQHTGSSTQPAPIQSTRTTPAPDAPPQLLPGQPTFASPEDAVAALYRASAAKDLKSMAHIVGLPEEDVLTGDAAKDAEQAQFFAKAHDEFLKIQPDGDARAKVFFGKDNYPLASPLVRQGDRWFFDSAGGKEELLARTIGENELATIGVCRTYVQAQYEYYSEDRNGDDLLEYAQKLGSTSGQRDGLYWHTPDGEPESPLGPLIAEARTEGYLRGSARRLDVPKPYHGYLFQVLTRQGKDAPGGAHDYIINGHMVAGFALVAYPAKWNHTGVMTFIVGANGKVFQKDLGQNTAATAGSITEYNPDATWTLVQE